jgi:hypothetical protein
MLPKVKNKTKASSGKIFSFCFNLWIFHAPTAKRSISSLISLVYLSSSCSNCL